MDYRIERVNELLIRELSYIIKTEVKDPRITEFVTITNVIISKDLQNAKVYYTVVGNKENQEIVGKVLNEASNFIRNKLKPRLTMRYTPMLRFFLDESFDNIERVSQLLKIIENEKNEN